LILAYAKSGKAGIIPSGEFYTIIEQCEIVLSHPWANGLHGVGKLPQNVFFNLISRVPKFKVLQHVSQGKLFEQALIYNRRSSRTTGFPLRRIVFLRRDSKL